MNKLIKHVKILYEFGISVFFFGLARKILNKVKLNSQYIDDKYYNSIVFKLKKKFGYIISKYKNTTPINYIDKNCKVWIFWWQGEESLPELNRMTINSVKKNLSNHELIILTKDNVKDYCTLPDEIFDKLENGLLSITNFSDVLRFNLLANHGGIWIDSTLLMTNHIDENLYNYSFYTIKHNKFANTHICRGKWSTFFMGASINNQLMQFVNEMLLSYCDKYDYFVTYLLIDCILNIAYDENTSFREIIDNVPINNENVFSLEKRLNVYNQPNELLDKLMKENNFFKLTYKNIHFKNMNNQVTVYGVLCKKYLK